MERKFSFICGQPSDMTRCMSESRSLRSIATGSDGAASGSQSRLSLVGGGIGRFEDQSRNSTPKGCADDADRERSQSAAAVRTNEKTLFQQHRRPQSANDLHQNDQPIGPKHNLPVKNLATIFSLQTPTPPPSPIHQFRKLNFSNSTDENEDNNSGLDVSDMEEEIQAEPRVIENHDTTLVESPQPPALLDPYNTPMNSPTCRRAVVIASNSSGSTRTNVHHQLSGKLQLKQFKAKSTACAAKSRKRKDAQLNSTADNTNNNDTGNSPPLQFHFDFSMATQQPRTDDEFQFAVPTLPKRVRLSNPKDVTNAKREPPPMQPRIPSSTFLPPLAKGFGAMSLFQS